MEKYIRKILESQPHLNVMSYLVEWNDGSTEWLIEEVENECPDCGHIIVRDGKKWWCETCGDWLTNEQLTTKKELDKITERAMNGENIIFDIPNNKKEVK